jgi:ThiF family
MSEVWSREEFYRLRDDRSSAVLGDAVRGEAPVHVAVDADACRSPAGQTLLLALSNQLARVHRTVTFDLAAPEAPLAAPSVFGGADLRQAILGGMALIDPFGRFTEASIAPESSVSLGVGERAPTNLDWYLGADGATGLLHAAPCRLMSSRAGTMRGAALASCMGAAAAFRVIHQLPVKARQLSAWNYAEGAGTDRGPDALPVLDVGRVLVVGAGAVASALVYWLHAFGVRGEWRIVDEDFVKLHNTNRSLVFLPSDAGWNGAEVQRKVDVLARFLPNARPEPVWYHSSTIAREPADVILALANEHDVRTAIASRSAPIVLHATTGENWVSQLHRHIVGRDDCIRCRTADVREPRFGCSTGAFQETATDEHRDAALPFLSAAAGLMLVTALQRLECGLVEVGDENDWRWMWDSMHIGVGSGIRKCPDECRQVQPKETRQLMNVGTRWVDLDR